LEKAKKQVEHELALIERLDFAGYFLIVWDLIDFCKENDILVQGRGSAANSAVCYALEITAVDPVGMDLLFERFLSESRGEWPDIDLDLPSGDKREQAIQYIYTRYGELGAAISANVITYRGKSRRWASILKPWVAYPAWCRSGSGKERTTPWNILSSMQALMSNTLTSTNFSSFACVSKTCRGILANTPEGW
jgi:hypothetical protein